jgi:hypothetical protein
MASVCAIEMMTPQRAEQYIAAMSLVAAIADGVYEVEPAAREHAIRVLKEHPHELPHIPPAEPSPIALCEEARQEIE